MLTRHLSLSANITAFCRFIRTRGFQVSATEEADALAALAIVPFDSSWEMHNVLRAILVKNVQQYKAFTENYNYYWSQLAKATDSKITESLEKKQKSQKSREKTPLQAVEALQNWLNNRHNESEEVGEVAAYDAVQVLSHKDFSALVPDEFDETAAIIRLIARTLANQVSRRNHPSNQHGRLDLRRIIRKNMQFGGELLYRTYQKPLISRVQLVLICDVSKSMELYSRFFVQFMYAFQNIYKSIETFVFSTSLYRITAVLKERDFDKALEEAAAAAPGWSSGTQIGASLQQFWETFGERKIKPNDIVLIISDGWDTGDGEKIGTYLENIQQKSGKVIWLNPLAGNPTYKPETAGMAAAMPYIDVFLPAHNAESLKNILPHLRKKKRRNHGAIPSL
jgi:uncharacterized protein